VDPRHQVAHGRRADHREDAGDGQHDQQFRQGETVRGAW